MNSQIPIQIDCQTCRTSGSMLKTTVPRFSGIIRVIGVILVIPSILGMVISALSFIFYLIGISQRPAQTTNAGGDVVVMATGIAVVFLGGIFIASLVSGLLGYLLLLNRKVFKCQRCGFVLDRA